MRRIGVATIIRLCCNRRRLGGVCSLDQLLQFHVPMERQVLKMFPFIRAVEINKAYLTVKPVLDNVYWYMQFQNKVFILDTMADMCGPSSLYSGFNCILLPLDPKGRPWNWMHEQMLYRRLGSQFHYAPRITYFVPQCVPCASVVNSHLREPICL